MRHMRGIRGVIGPALVLIGGCASPGSAGSVEETPRVGDPLSIWDGVYTSAQADRGERVAWGNCFSCHTVGEWSNPRIMNPAPDQRLGNLFQMISRSMPMDSPGRLSADEYADVIAYMLRLQGAPPGVTELPSEIDRLDRILVTSRVGP
jgi:mono/diheme cytochrome c family protein